MHSALTRQSIFNLNPIRNPLLRVFIRNNLPVKIRGSPRRYKTHACSFNQKLLLKDQEQNSSRARICFGIRSGAVWVSFQTNMVLRGMT